MDFSLYQGNGVTSGLDELANLAASFGAGELNPDEEGIDIGADVGEDLESDLSDEEGGKPAVLIQEGPRRTRGEVDYAEGDGTEGEEESVKAEPMDEEFDDDDDDSDTYGGDVNTPAPDGMSYDLQALFPTFQPGAILNFTDLLSAPPKKRPRLAVKAAKIRMPDVSDVPVAPSTVDQALEPLHPTVRSQVARLLATYKPRVTADVKGGEHADEAYAKLLDQWELPPLVDRPNKALDVDDWENRIAWRASQAEDENSMAVDEVPGTGKRKRDGGPLPFRNEDLDSGDWTRSIIWSRNAPYTDFTRLQLTVSQIAAVDEEDEEMSAERRRLLLSGEVDPLNISNDRIYEAARERRAGVRQTLSSLEVQHAYPAKKLQLPFYKIQLTKTDARAFHRPALSFPINLNVVFTKVRSTKKKRDKVSGHKLRAGEDVMHTTTDLSLRDTGPFVLLEYSEEYPTIMSNLGMGSILVNYYRKKSDKEEVTPAEFGETFVLEPSDETPFRKFGDVRPGQTVQALYNDLVRAPVFRHNAATTDFLVVKVSGDGETRYYLREIKNLFVVGQTLPLKEVPGPHSRRLTALTKARLMLIARRLCGKNGDGRCHIQNLLKYFDDHSPLQMRQRIKDFMDFVGNSQWAFKPIANIPSELDNREVASPEEIVLYEAMQVGQRHLLDLGYGQAAGAEGGNDDDESKLDSEQQLAPWTSTKNFLLASQSKAMLALNGEGDPTGRGEGFNFQRISMKDIFVPSGVDREEFIAQKADEQGYGTKKYNVQEQQELYKAEIAKIWAAQAKALSNPKPPKLTAEDEARNRFHTPGDTPFGESPRDTPGIDSGAGASGKVLKIRRKIGGQIVTERIKDPKVIMAYIKQRKIVEEESTAPEDIQISNDAAENDRNKAKLEKLLATMKRNQQRRQQRRQMMAASGSATAAAAVAAAAALKKDDDDDANGDSGKKGKAGVSTRVYCGLVGHMKTNKKCPRYHEFFPGGAPKRQPKGAAMPTAINATPAIGAFTSMPAHNIMAPAAAASPPHAGSPEPPKLKMSLSDLK